MSLKLMKHGFISEWKLTKEEKREITNLDNDQQMEETKEQENSLKSKS